MTPIVNLYILADKFSSLSKSVYFDPALMEFSEKTVEAIKHVIKYENVYPERLVRRFAQHVWGVVKFVRGSRSSEAPYETQYVLKKALKDWIPDGAIIANAAQEDMRFFFVYEDIWKFFIEEFEKFNAKGFRSLKNYRPLFVRMGSPEAFKHRPIFCVPLFHELGHFIDLHYGISESSFFFMPAPEDIKLAVEARYRKEYFADLFAASYCGASVKESLLASFPENGNSNTHPSTNSRASMVHKFLNQSSDPMISALNESCIDKSGNELTVRFSSPEIANSFDDMLTYRIESDEELFGIYDSGWKYFHNQLEKRDAPWIAETATPHEIEKKNNDLVEKSIRNYEIRERWLE